MTPAQLSAIRSVLGPLASPSQCEKVWRVVLEGVREPTEEMIDASSEDWLPVLLEHRGQRYEATEGVLRDGAGAKVWRWMIDALLQAESAE